MRPIGELPDEIEMDRKVSKKLSWLDDVLVTNSTSVNNKTDLEPVSNVTWPNALNDTVVTFSSDVGEKKRKQGHGGGCLGSIFRYADRLDIFLMAFGTVLAVIHGAITPMALYFVFSQVLNAMISASSCFDPIKNATRAISTARQRGTLGSLSPDLQAFMNSSQYEGLANYKSLHAGEGYSLFGEVGPLCGIYALIGLVCLVVGSAHIACWSIAGQRQLRRIREALYRALLSKDAYWYDDQKNATVKNTIFEMVNKMERGMTSNVSICISWLSLAATGFIVAFVRDWLVTIVLSSLVPLLFIVGFVMIKIVRKYSGLQSLAYGKAGSIANEILGNIRTIVAFNKQEYEVERYHKSLGESRHMGMIKTVATGAGDGLSHLITGAITALAFWWGENPQVKQAGGNVLQIITCVLLGTMSLAYALPSVQSIASSLGGSDEVFKIIDEEITIDNFDEEGKRIDDLKGEIEFEEVAFAYPSAPERLILKSLTLSLKPGQTVALVGPSGCGKSTTALLLMRFYEAVKGRVTIDGVDVRSLNVRWLRQSIGLVGQEPILFNMSIKDNIKLGALHLGEISDEAVVEACKLSNAHSFISSLPQGYETMVGERGAQLSGGQKQRIAIARALISNPKILILDEATSALDTASEKIVQDAFDKARIGRTTLVIAHRLSTIRKADQIVVIEAGEIAEIGNHVSLLNKGGLYARLARAQMAKTAPGPAGEGEEAGAKRRPSKAFLKRFSWGKILTVEVDPVSGEVVTDEEGGEGPSVLDLISTVLDWGKPELRLIIIGACLTAIVGAIYPASGIVQSEFLGNFCPGDVSSKFSMLIGIYVAIDVFHGIVITIEHYIFGLIGENLTLRMRRLLMSKFLIMDASWLDCQENQPSHLAAILLNDCIGIQGLSGLRVCIYVQDAVIIAIIVIYSLILDYRIGLVLMTLIPLRNGASWLYEKILIGNKKADKADGAIGMEAINNIRTVMALGAEPYFLGAYSTRQIATTALAIRKSIATGPLFSFRFAIIIWSGAITCCLGSWLMQNEHVEFMTIIRIYFLVTFAGFRIGEPAYDIPDEEIAKAATLKIAAILGEKPEIDEEDEETCESFAAKQLAGETTLAIRGTGKIEFHNVAFKYPTRPGVKILKNVSFTILPGQRVAICGPSGCGKSTIIHLIERIYDPDLGTVFVDEDDIRNVNVRALRSNIGLVGQEPSLFAMSIAENISYGAKLTSEPPSEREIENACRQANAYEFLNRLPEGLNTNVGDRGGQISGGQKQRIAIARALVRNPSILLLDEATSALDTESERIVQEALDVAAQGRTTVAIAHRLSTIQNYDKIIVLARGEIAEQGTHAELMSLRGIYYHLHEAQNKGGAKEDSMAEE